jgi:hypothetical protein
MGPGEWTWPWCEGRGTRGPPRGGPGGGRRPLIDDDLLSLRGLARSIGDEGEEAALAPLCAEPSIAFPAEFLYMARSRRDLSLLLEARDAR